MRAVRLCVPVAAIAFAFVAFAPAALAADTHPCAATADPSERLACYDKAFPPAPGARYGDVGMTPAEREARRQRAMRDFGLNQSQKDEKKPEAERDVNPDRIEAGVVKVTYRASGERVVTLDNGQVWLITEVTEKGWMKPGDRISVRTALMGTYMLDTGRVQLRARRLQ